jgi:hypothetical protein
LVCHDVVAAKLVGRVWWVFAANSPHYKHSFASKLLCSCRALWHEFCREGWREFCREFRCKLAGSLMWICCLIDAKVFCFLREFAAYLTQECCFFFYANWTLLFDAIVLLVWRDSACILKQRCCDCAARLADLWRDYDDIFTRPCCIVNA